MLGIGLGGVATGLDRGIGLRKQLDGTPEEQRQRTAKEAAGEAQTEFDAQGGGSIEQFQKFLAPRVAAKFIKAGDLEGAKQWQDWSKDENNRAATTKFGEGMIAAQAGDTGTALKKFIEAGRTKGYGADYKIDEPEKTDSGGWRVNITGGDGKKFTQEFRSSDDVLRFGATHLNPEAAFKSWQQSQSEAAKRKSKLDDELTEYRGKKGIDLDHERRKGELGLGAGNFEVIHRQETDPDTGAVKTRSYKFDKRSGRMDAIEGEGAFDKPGRAGAGGKRFQFEVVRDAYKNLGYSDQDATDIASGQKPPKDTDLLNIARQITNMEMPPSDMRYNAEKRRAALDKNLQDLRQQYSRGPRGQDSNLTGPGKTITGISVQDAPAKPLDIKIPPRPGGVPSGSAYSPSRGMWRSPDGKVFDAQGKPVP